MAEKIQMNKFKILAASIGIVYIWFGFLKFFPGLSPAEELAKDTIHYLTMGLIPADLSLKLLAIWEVGIGLLLVFAPVRKTVIALTLLHMFLTFTPFLFFPDMSFNQAPFKLTLVGQYIIKNIIIISALMVIYPWESKMPYAERQQS